MLTTALAQGLLCATLAAALPPTPPPPPLPDFKTPVDYLAWYDQAVAYANADNALGHYGVFLYGDQDAPAERIAPMPESNAAKALDRLRQSPQMWYPQSEPGLALWVNNTEARYLRAFSAENATYYATRRPPDLALLADVGTPALHNGRLIGQMMFLRAWRVADNTLYDNRLVEAVTSNLIFANHIGQGFTLDEQFFAIGHHAFIYDQLQRSLSSRVHTIPIWQKIIAVLEEQDAEPLTRAYARSLYFSEAATLQLLQHFSLPDDKDAAAPAPSIHRDRVDAWLEHKYPNPRLRPRNVAALVNADPTELVAAIHAYYHGMRTLLEQDFVVDLADKLAIVESQTLGKHPELGVILTPIGFAVQSAFRTEAERRLTYLFLKMALPFKKTDNWPQSFDELKGPRVASSRIDPFTGRDMRLRAAQHNVRVPYSIGQDGKDDGGDPTADIILWGRVAPEAQYQKATSAPTTPPRSTTQPAAPAAPPTTRPASDATNQ